MNDSFFLRHKDILPPELHTRDITIIGAGAVGGWTALALAKMGFSALTVYDYDDVAEENVGCQLYGPDHVGGEKVHVLQTLIHTLTGTHINCKYEKWEGQRLQGIVIAAVDSMAVRKQVWEACKKQALGIVYYIDPRMGAEQAALYVMEPGNAADVKTYEKTLYSDDEAMFEPCTAKATSYTAMLLGGAICKATKDVVIRTASDRTGGQPLPDYARITQWNIADNAIEIQRASEANRT